MTNTWFKLLVRRAVNGDIQNAVFHSLLLQRSLRQPGRYPVTSLYQTLVKPGTIVTQALFCRFFFPLVRSDIDLFISIWLIQSLHLPLSVPPSEINVSLTDAYQHHRRRCHLANQCGTSAAFFTTLDAQWPNWIHYAFSRVCITTKAVTTIFYKYAPLICTHILQAHTYV